MTEVETSSGRWLDFQGKNDGYYEIASETRDDRRMEEGC